MNKLKIFKSNKLILATLTVLGIASASFVSFVSQPEYASAVTSAELSDQIKALEAESAQYQAEADRKRHEANSLENTLSAITVERSAIQAQLDVSQTKYTQMEARISEINSGMESQRRTLSKLVARIYINGNVTPIEILASSESVGDFVSKQEIRTAVRSKIQDTVKEIKTLKDELALEQQKIAQNIKDQKAQSSALIAKETEQAKLLEATRGEESRFQQLSAEAEQKRKKAFAALESLNTSNLSVSSTGYVRAGDVIGYVGNTGMTTGPHLHLEARVGGSVTNPSAYNWITPTSGPISQGFGNPSSWYANGYHPGIDYAPAAGTPIRAVADGTLYRGCTDSILGPGYSNAYGYMAIIEHAGGVQSLYGHMQAGPDGGACNYGYFQF